MQSDDDIHDCCIIYFHFIIYFTFYILFEYNNHKMKR